MASDLAKLAALLKQGVEVNAAQVDGMTALHWAVYHDDLRTTALLLRVPQVRAPHTGFSLSGPEVESLLLID